MNKKLFFKFTIIFMCFLLVGCGSKKEEERETTNIDVVSITERSKKAFENFNIDLEKINIKYDYIDAFTYDDELYVTIYLKNKLTEEERKIEHTEIVNYLKTISKEEKIYNIDNDNEYDIESISGSSLWLKTYLYDLEYKIYIGSHFERILNNYTYPDSYNIIIQKNIDIEETNE